MMILKKLLFAPIFLVSWAVLLYFSVSYLKSSDLFLSLSITSLIQTIVICALITISSLFFVLFAALSMDWKLIISVGLIASVIPFLFFNSSLGIIVMVGTIVSLLLGFVGLENSMKSYLSFNPHTILTPIIKHLSTLLILIFCIVYFLTSNKQIVEKGFSLPDSLIDAALKFSPQPTDTNNLQPSIPQDQLNLLKQNPQLLKQSGLDPKILDSLSQPQKSLADVSNNLIKQTIKDQIQSLIKPYLNLIAPLLAVLLFLTLQSFTALINLLLSPILWIVFYLLEKSGYIRFEIEQRPVKKMVI